MIRRISVAVCLLLVAMASARDKVEDWLELRSQHFIVVSNASEKQTRNVADQLERMRAVFQKLFPRLESGSGAPITVIAVKNEKDFRSLEPESYLSKGQLQLAGLFLRAGDSNFILLRLDAGGEHPYATVYHEYTHFLTGKAMEWMPLWLVEGMAEFYQNTQIGDKETVLGQPSAENILLLRQNRLLPLPTLLQVDRTSPYYHEENKGSIFYAESWLLTHYLMMKDFNERATKLASYLDLVSQKVDAMTAATQVFGDLNILQKELENYTRQSSFRELKMSGAVKVNDAEFKLRPLAPAQAAAARAEFLAYNDRGADARALLQAALRDDPTNVSAHETMGYLEFRQGHLEEAQNWFGKAVKLDSKSYLAHYYFAAIAMSGTNLPAEDRQQIESSLRTAIELNPSFAPAYNQLAIFFGTQHRNLDEAYMLTLNAVQNDPENIGYRLNAANVLMMNQRGADAIRVIETALKIAKSPEQVASLQNALQMAKNYQAAQEAWQQKAHREVSDGNTPQSFADGSDAGGKLSSPPAEEVSLKGPRRSATGTIKDVRCSAPARMDLKLDGPKGTMDLQAANYYKVEFSAIGFVPDSDLHPCSDLEGQHARVEFVEPSGKMPQILAIELSK